MFRNMNNKKQNRYVLFYFGIFAGLFLFTIFYKLSVITDIISFAVTIVGTGIVGLVNKEQTLEKARIPHGLDKIKRNDDVESLLAREGFIFVTGSSGVGKSVLLGQVKDYLEKKEKTVSEISEYYGLTEDDLQGSQYIILDQFERILWMSDNRIKEIRNLILKLCKTKKIIISFRKDYAIDIYELFSEEGTIPSYFVVKNTPGVLQGIRAFFEKLTQSEKSEAELAEWIVQDASQNKVTMIQIENLSKGYREYGKEKMVEMWRSAQKDYDRLMSLLWSEDIKKLSNFQSAYEILYFLSLDSKQQFSYSFQDFQSITFLPDRQLLEVVNFLEEEKWIQMTGNKGLSSMDSVGNGKYIMAHDYYRDNFNKMISEILDPQIRKNIDYYFRNCLSPRLNDGRIPASSKIHDACRKFISIDSRRYVNIMLYLLLMVYGAISTFAVREITADSTKVRFALMNIAVGGSVIYAYNYYYHFLSFFGKRYIYVPVVGMLLCPAIYFFPQYWGIVLGFEVLTVGIAVFQICFHCRNQEKSFFRTKGIIYSIIGIVIIFFGWVSSLFIKDNPFSDLPFFILYIVYIFMAVKGHINMVNLHSLVGKVSYDSE